MSDLLIADDEKWIRKGIIAKLKKSGLHFDDIYEAGDGLEAKNLIEEKRPRIAITDIIMPRLDGLELMEWDNRNQFGTRFVIISGYSEFRYAQKAINLGAEGYILKPITDYDLVSILQKVLQGDPSSEAGQQQISGRDIISRAREYITANYDRDITVKDIAAHVSVHPNYLSGLFRKETGETLTQYLTGVRIEAACYLLRKSDEPIGNISSRVGYQDNQYFHRVFKKVKGQTPTDFRNQYRNG